MRILLDTHIALWANFESSKLPESAKELLIQRANIVYYSMASIWEVAIKHAVNRDNMPVPEERFVEVCNQTGFLELPIVDEHIFALKSLSRQDNAPHHNDPFDRLLIAQAKVEGMHLLTHDKLLEGYGEPCVLLC
ncbi:MAG: type II toxin-antitoxin system VapC family toxin [Atopobiaceae bacterium]|nr:type II toxin-antitoxin system VapC family toxin [Atopobiaceae bacterium]